MMGAAELRRLIRRWLAEDVGPGDLTTRACVPDGAEGSARIVSRGRLVMAGGPVAAAVFAEIDPGLRVELPVAEGAEAGPGLVVATISGRLAPILTAERTALNLLGRMCGIATATRAAVGLIEGTGVRLADTRKTVPGLRALDKLAVRIGGGVNHRLALYDGILIKENHIRAAGSIAAAVRAARSAAHHLLRIEVEVTCRAELAQALEAGAEAVLLDNMTPAEVQACALLASGRACVEVSGGVTPENLRQYALPGVDLISCGFLTHSVRNADLSLLVD